MIYVLVSFAAFGVIWLLGQRSKALTNQGDFKARFFTAYSRINSQGIPVGLAYAVASLETDKGRSNALAKTNSLFNRHVGSSKGVWTGNVYTTNSGEPLRIYASWEQSMQDFIYLLQDPLYSKARAFALANRGPEFFKALAEGNGKVGYVGKANSPHSIEYATSLSAIYGRILDEAI